jgi:hypothetical protein
MEARNSTDARKRAELTARKLRSAISNGSVLLDDLDHRSSWARRLRDLIGAYTSDLGGNSNISEAERVLVRRASMLTLQLELMERHFALNGGEATAPQLECYQRATNTLRRTLEALGLERRQKDVGDLADADLTRAVLELCGEATP